eukprot:gene37681-36186_t
MNALVMQRTIASLNLMSDIVVLGTLESIKVQTNIARMTWEWVYSMRRWIWAQCKFALDIDDIGAVSG